MLSVDESEAVLVAVRVIEALGVAERVTELLPVPVHVIEVLAVAEREPLDEVVPV